MFGSSILEVAIGLIFIYSLLALICSAVKESLENWLNKRAADLERGIREMFKDQAGTGFTKVFFDHPIICCLYKGWYEPESTGWWARIWRWLYGGNLPSYIPSSNVADAILDIVRRPDAQKSWGVPQADGVANVADPTWQPVGNDRRPLTVAATGPSLHEAIENIPNPQIKQVFRAIVDSVGEDIDKVKKELENWFNSSMERVSGWYKRWTQVVIFVIGILLVAGLNADTIAIVSALSKDKELRSRLALAAEQFEKDHQSKAKPEGKTTGSEVTVAEDIKKFKDNIKLNDLGLPLGWESQPHGWSGWLQKILGLVMTSFAISLGAQFWFDTLSRVINIRATLKPREQK